MPFHPLMLVALGAGAYVLTRKKKEKPLPGPGEEWATSSKYFYFRNFPDFEFYPVTASAHGNAWMGLAIKTPWHLGANYVREVKHKADPYEQLWITSNPMPPTRFLIPEAVDREVGVFAYRTEPGPISLDDEVVAELYKWILEEWNVDYYHRYHALLDSPELESGDCISDDPPYCYKIYADQDQPAGRGPIYIVELLGQSGNAFSKVTDLYHQPGGTIPIGMAKFRSMPVALAWAMDALKYLKNTRALYEPMKEQAIALKKWG